MLDLIEKRMREIVEPTAAAFDCDVEFHFKRNYPPTVNHAEQTRFAASVMAEIVGAENVDASVEPTMGAEDFSFMLLEKPGCYAFLGNGDGGHRESAMAPDRACCTTRATTSTTSLLSVGSTYWVRLAERFLAGLAGA